MGKGFLFGILFGAIFAVMSLSAVSLMAPPVGSRIMIVTTKVDQTGDSAEPAVGEAPVPQAVIVEVPAGSEFARPKSEQVAILPNPEPVPATSAAPQSLVLEAEPAPVLADTGPASVPTGQPESPTAMQSPDTAPVGVDPAKLSVEAITSAPSGHWVPTPALETDVATTDLAPTVDLPAVAEVPQTVTAAEISGMVTVAPQPLAKVEVVMDETVKLASAASVPASSLSAAPAPAQELPRQSPDAAVAEILVVPPTLPTIPTADPTQVRLTDQPAREIVTPEPQGRVAQAQLPQTAPIVPDTAPTVPPEPFGSATAPQPGLAATVPGVRINRLPTIGADSGNDPVVETPGVPLADNADGGETADLSAIVRYAAAFDNTANRPLFSIVILDVGQENGGADPAALTDLGLPVTIAISPASASAVARASGYRDAELEVAILAPELPVGATPADLEVSYQSFVATLPETVALIGAPDAIFQTDRRVAQHLASLLAADGRGMITYSRGLNPAKQAADKEGLPNVAVYRVVDADHESSATIGRYLDRAAFEAQQKGQIVVVAHSYPETLAGLKSWAVAGAKGMAVAPVSAAMLAQIPVN